MRPTSLRQRLILIILVPLLIIASGVGTWRVNAARETAQDLFDKNLLFTALAVSRDVALLDGDAISPETEKLLSDSAGGPIKYHVYAPDGVFVTGYATPPVPISETRIEGEAFTYFDAVERGKDVRVLRLFYVTTIAGFSGTFSITVWQDTSVRNQFVRGLALRAVALMAALIGTVVVVVWFGVNFGLKPLFELEEAISKRSAEDLSPIQRAVPKEARRLVLRLNELFQQVSTTMRAQSVFISDAAHQLRNPIAGVRALGESILTAQTLESSKERAKDLIQAAEQAGRLADNLLTLERIRATPGTEEFRQVSLHHLIGAAVTASRVPATRPEVQIVTTLGANDVMLSADPVLLQEAIVNIVDNALVHGGDTLGRIEITLESTTDQVEIKIADDGCGVAPEDVPKILSRFGQVQPSKGSGLGLSIAEAIAAQHGGTLKIVAAPEDKTGFAVVFTLPRNQTVA